MVYDKRTATPMCRVCVSILGAQPYERNWSFVALFTHVWVVYERGVVNGIRHFLASPNHLDTLSLLAEIP